MSIEFNLRPDLESRVKALAAASGLPVEKWLEGVIEQAAASPTARTGGSGTLDLFAAWDAEDTTADPEEVERRKREFDEFRRVMNENRPGQRPLYP